MKNHIKRPFFLSGTAIPAVIAGIMLTGIESATAVFVITAVICAILCIKRNRFAKHCLVICAVITAAAFSFSITDGMHNAVSCLDGISATVYGTVSSYPEATSGDSFVTRLSSCSINGKDIYGKIDIYTENSPLCEPGDRIIAECTELQSTDNDGIYRYHGLSQKIYLSAFATDISVTEAHSETGILNRILTLRKFFTDKLSRNMSPDNAALTNALITGDKNTLSPDISATFRISGISHIFAVSGMHLSLWTGFFFIILKQRMKNRIIPNIAAILFVIFYTVFTGFSPSVLRAGIMLLPTFVAGMIHKKTDALNSLGFAGTVLLLVNPYLAGNISFLLSYIATFALIGVAPYFSVFIPESNKSKRILKRPLIASANSILISLCVIMLTLPITTVFFGYASLLSPISSLLMTPVAELLMISGTLSAVFPAGNPISSLLFGISEFSSELIIRYIFSVRNLDFAIIPTDTRIILPCFIITVAAVLIFSFLIKKHRISVAITLISIITAVCLTFSQMYKHSGETEIYIPQSDSSFSVIVTSYDGISAIYTDGPDYEDISRISSYLNKKGIICPDYCLSLKNGNHERRIKQVLMPEKTIELYEKKNAPHSEDIQLWDDVHIYSEKFTSFSASVFTVQDIKIVICTDAQSDFSYSSEVFSDGDILICRDSLPEGLNEERFREILIISDDTVTDTVTNRNNTRITIKGDTYVVY